MTKVGQLLAKGGKHVSWLRITGKFTGVGQGARGRHLILYSSIYIDCDWYLLARQTGVDSSGNHPISVHKW